MNLYHILPLSYEGPIKYEDIIVQISAQTTQSDYRGRKYDDKDTLVIDNQGRAIYKDYETYDCGTYSYTYSSIPTEIGESISHLFDGGCNDGKYPNMRVRLNDNYYLLTSEEYDQDSNRGLLSVEYRLRIHVF